MSRSPNVTTATTLPADWQQALRKLTDHEAQTKLEELQKQVWQKRSQYLLDAGQIYNKKIKGSSVDPSRCAYTNACLNALEGYETAIICALTKLDYLRLMLRISNDHANENEHVDEHKVREQDVKSFQEQAEFQKEADEIFHTSLLRVVRIKHTHPDICHTLPKWEEEPLLLQYSGLMFQDPSTPSTLSTPSTTQTVSKS